MKLWEYSANLSKVQGLLGLHNCINTLFGLTRFVKSYSFLKGYIKIIIFCLF